MQKHIFTLLSNTPLTHNVHELIFDCSNETTFIPGQFITFFIDHIGARAYSVLQKNGNTYSFIIKRVQIEEGGRGGSIFLCDLKVGAQIEGIGPIGHFTIQENHTNKLFLGTGTGFVPLYNQIFFLLEKKYSAKYSFIFGVKTLQDLFYISKLEELSKKYKNFQYHIYLSQETQVHNYHSGRINQFIQEQNIDLFNEFYICGSPTMVDEISLVLKQLGKQNIYFEKY